MRELQLVARATRLVLGGAGVVIGLVCGSVAVGTLVEILGDAARRGATQWSLLFFFTTAALVGGALALWGFRRPPAPDDGDAERAVLTLASSSGGVTTEADIVMRTALSAAQARRTIERLRALGLIEPVSGADGAACRIVRPVPAAATLGLPTDGPAHPTVARIQAVVARYGLTPAEANVLELVATGLSNDEIGGRLFVSPATVRTHLSTVFRKLGVRSRVQAALLVTQARDTPDDREGV